MSDLTLTLLQEEEGVAAHVYKCDGLWHIAMGALVDSSVPSDGLCKEAIDAQSLHDIAKAQGLAASLVGFDTCNEIRQAVLISMCFQLGDLHAWPNFKAALAAGDYTKASQAGLDSEWARTQTPLRAMREMQMLESGNWIPKGEIE